MENLPEELFFEIIERLPNTSDQDSLFLASKQLHRIKADQIHSIKIGCKLKSLTKSYLTSLCIRYPFLTKIEINYYGWNSYLGKKQLDNQGLSILSTNCLFLTNLTLIQCSFITDSGLSHLASCKNLMHLAILKCRCINEDSLVKLRNCLRRLKQLEFKIDMDDPHPTIHDPLVTERPQICYQNLKELNLTNCVFQPERGPSLIFSSCTSLEKVCLDGCFDLEDRDIISLSETSRGLKSISLKRFSVSYLTDASFKALRENCLFLENVELVFPSGSWSPSLITIEAVLALILGRSIRTVVLKNAQFLNESAMKALSSASASVCLQTLDINGFKWVVGLK